MGKSRRKYIYNLARTIAGQVKFNFLEFNPNSQSLGKDILEKYGYHIERTVARWSPETQGRVVALGSDSLREKPNACTLKEVHGSVNWLDGDRPGNDLLLEIVVTTIVAKMIDNLREDFVNACITGKAKPGLYVEDIRFYNQVPPHTPTHRPDLNEYDARRDRWDTGELVPYEGTFGVYGEEA